MLKVHSTRKLLFRGDSDNFILEPYKITGAPDWIEKTDTFELATKDKCLSVIENSEQQKKAENGELNKSSKGKKNNKNNNSDNSSNNTGDNPPSDANTGEPPADLEDK